MLFWIIGRNGLLASTWCNLLPKISSSTLSPLDTLSFEKTIPYISTSGKEVNVLDKKKVWEFFEQKKPTHIINCSAYTAVDLAEKEKKQANALNRDALMSLAELPAKIVHYSTDYVFDGLKKSPYFENDQASPINHYGKSKLLGEETLLTNPRALIIRTSWLFCERGKNFFTTMQNLMNTREEIRVVGDQFGRPTYTDHLVYATLLLLRSNATGLFHYADEEKCSWYEFALQIREALNKRTRIEKIAANGYPTLAKRPPYSVLATEKYQKATGVSPFFWENAFDNLKNPLH